jgi:hypothetical protein
MPARCLASIQCRAWSGVMSPFSTSATLPVSEPKTVMSTFVAPGHLFQASSGHA